MEWFIKHEKEMFVVAMLTILVLFALVNVFIGWQMFKNNKK
tara:strand:+ start:382 stop:504 length:123 start_codon:yes stop_codon:yes gene_type:complete